MSLSYCSDFLLGCFFVATESVPGPFAIGGAALGMTYSAAYSVAKYVAAKTVAYDFVRHSFTRDINSGSLWLAVPAGLASAILFRAIVFPRRFEKRAKSW
jgi:hypothetical protein